MIELNCTYEESKKILELGYNFSYICYEYQSEPDSYPCLPHPDEIPEGIPIIPKAALEACLPDDGNLKGLKWFGCSLYNPLYLFNLPNDGGLQYTINLSSFRVKSFKSAFEAFAWCHEHYPEELKKKFEEVMK